VQIQFALGNFEDQPKIYCYLTEMLNMAVVHLFWNVHFLYVLQVCMRWAGHVARMGEGRGAYRVSVGRPEGRRPLGRPRHRWEDNIKMDLQEVGWGAWTGLIWLRIGTGGGPL
jgi:hypothetical protein